METANKEFRACAWAFFCIRLSLLGMFNRTHDSFFFLFNKLHTTDSGFTVPPLPQNRHEAEVFDSSMITFMLHSYRTTFNRFLLFVVKEQNISMCSARPCRMCSLLTLEELAFLYCITSTTTLLSVLFSPRLLLEAKFLLLFQSSALTTPH